VIDHRQLGVDLYNHVWTLLEKQDRTREEDDEMLHAAHASRYHWGEVGRAENLARGEWQCSRVYAVLGRGEAATHHAQRCLDICLENGIGDWDLAAAYEALARAQHAAGNADEFRRNLELGREAARKIAEDDDREHIERDLEALTS
jgi:hypothetical protein